MASFLDQAIRTLEVLRVPQRNGVERALRHSFRGRDGVDDPRSVSEAKYDDLFMLYFLVNGDTLVSGKDGAVPYDARAFEYIAGPNMVGVSRMRVPLRIRVVRVEGGSYTEPWSGTVRQLFETARRVNGKLHRSRCRSFIMNVLAANSLLTPNVRAWIMQPPVSLLRRASAFQRVFDTRGERVWADDVEHTITGRRGTEDIRALIAREAEEPQSDEASD